MAQLPKGEAKLLYDAVRKALSSWDKQNAAPETLLGQLLSVQQARESLNAGDNPALLRAATNTVLTEAISNLEMQNARCANVLRNRFDKGLSIRNVAISMSFSEHQISRLQRSGIEQVVEILLGREEDIKRERAQSLKSIIPPPTFTRLFGIDDFCQTLITQLTTEGAPWVIALVGMGGLGKTAVANFITRTLIQQLDFTHLAWIKAEPSHSFSGQAEPPSLSYEKILVALLTQLYPGMNPPTSLPARETKIRQALKANTYLVVIDNLEATEDTSFLLNHLNELANPSKFLLTTRTRAAKQAAILDMPLDELNFADSATFMRHHAEETGGNGRCPSRRCRFDADF